MVDAKGNSLNSERSEIGRQREKLVLDEFTKRIGCMFISPVKPRSYGGIYTKNGYASARHSVNGEKIAITTNIKKDEWVIETEYKYNVADVDFSHYYRYYIVNIDGTLKIAAVMIIDKDEISGNSIYRDL
jgi:hypothetical protein